MNRFDLDAFSGDVDSDYLAENVHGGSSGLILGYMLQFMPPLVEANDANDLAFGNANSHGVRAGIFAAAE